MLDILTLIWGWLAWLAPYVLKEDFLKRLILTVFALLIFCMLCGFCGSEPIEYTDDGVIIHDMEVYNNRMIFSDDDRDLLIRVAVAEAGNQGVKGQALVMRVVINRWQSGRYGETLREVIFAPNQFYTNGMYRCDIWSVWDGSLTAGQRRQILDGFNALAWVTYGWDESEGALYFCSEGWNYYGKEHLFKYGDHWFSK